MEKQVFGPIVFLVGLVAGSFNNVCIYRLPRGESIVWPPSHCPHCGHKLSFWDLIPIFSYIFLRGKCRYCQGKITGRYAVVELATALFFLAMFFKVGVDWTLFPLCVIGCGLIVTFFVDLGHGIVLDSTVLAIGGAGVVLALIETYVTNGGGGHSQVLGSLVGAVAAAGIFFLIKVIFTWVFRREAMGWGDVTLAAAIGTFVPFGYAFLAFFLVCIAGGFVVGMTLRALKVRGPWAEIPFGPFMVVAALAMLFLGDSLTALAAALYGGRGTG